MHHTQKGGMSVIYVSDLEYGAVEASHLPSVSGSMVSELLPSSTLGALRTTGGGSGSL